MTLTHFPFLFVVSYQQKRLKTTTGEKKQFMKYLLSVCYVPCNVLGAGNTEVIEMWTVP